MIITVIVIKQTLITIHHHILKTIIHIQITFKIIHHIIIIITQIQIIPHLYPLDVLYQILLCFTHNQNPLNTIPTPITPTNTVQPLLILIPNAFILHISTYLLITSLQNTLTK